LFDLVVMLLLSNVVPKAVIGDDNSLTGDLIRAMLVAFNGGLVRVINRNPTLPGSPREPERFSLAMARSTTRRAGGAVCTNLTLPLRYVDKARTMSVR
jgi:hypothetical protein